VGQFHVLDGVIPSAAVFQAERGILRGAATHTIHARSLGPLERARASGMTQIMAEIQNDPPPKEGFVQNAPEEARTRLRRKRLRRSGRPLLRVSRCNLP